MRTLPEIDKLIEAKREELDQTYNLQSTLESELEVLKDERHKLTSKYRIMWDDRGEKHENYRFGETYEKAQLALLGEVRNRAQFGVLYRRIDETHYEADTERGHWVMWVEENPHYVAVPSEQVNTNG